MNTAPNTKYSHRDGIEVLYFIVPKNYANAISLYGSISLYDGYQYLNVKLMDVTTGTTNPGGLYAVNVGYDALGLSAYETSGEKIRQVDFQLLPTIRGVTGYTYSEIKSYMFELDEQPDNFNVCFLNKLGTYETYSSYGELVEDQDIQRSQYQKPYNVASCVS